MTKGARSILQMSMRPSQPPTPDAGGCVAAIRDRLNPFVIEAAIRDRLNPFVIEAAICVAFVPVCPLKTETHLNDDI